MHFVEHGLIHVYERTGRAHLCQLLETVVALVLKRRGAELAYALTSDEAEVDFAVSNADGTKALKASSAAGGQK
jgi:predicted AAA+ superfamily ATPase